MKKLDKILMLLILVTIVIFSVMGCGSKHWYKPDMTEEQFKRDHYECQRDVIFAQSGGYWVHTIGMFEQCMGSKGYKWIKN
jgi:uncharacterized lipoprotein YehR (DUF1307 family)